MRNLLIIFYFISVTIITISCTKSVLLTSLDFQKQILSGTGLYQNTQHTWKLDSAYINNVPLVLTSIQKNYKKTYSSDGTYNDTDFKTGKWEINVINKLKETFINKTLNIQDSLVYDIVSINGARLNLSVKLLNGQNATYSFTITN